MFLGYLSVSVHIRVALKNKMRNVFFSPPKFVPPLIKIMCAKYYLVLLGFRGRPVNLYFWSSCHHRHLHLLTLCGLTSQKTHRRGLGLGGSVHEEAHPCFPYLVQPSFKGIDAGSIYHPLVQLIPSINHSV